ncbi:hypothetical protein SAMN05428969_1456 [Devosia sp. YR412]|uniref:hypothetical protein n=1 Tax=Devosia sp. YR412 TaxID=1881030 RepID=UPI0008BB682A|nr:hypothetical protein [Devosia sp. YR412]SEP99490.1 hypothetical protein SAMN05428969_1456 [Devosia sp. YR412]
MTDMRRHSWLAELKIEGLFHGKPQRFLEWRSVIADIVGAPVHYVSVQHPFDIPTTIPAPPLTLEFIEARVTDQAWLAQMPPGFRHGIWDETPEEPLWILLLASLPGATFYARHAAAISQRLDEIDEMVHHVGKGWVTERHEIIRQSFAEQARTGRDMTMSGGYEPTGWWTPKLP